MCAQPHLPRSGEKHTERQPQGAQHIRAERQPQGASWPFDCIPPPAPRGSDMHGEARAPLNLAAPRAGPGATERRGSGRGSADDASGRLGVGGQVLLRGAKGASVAMPTVVATNEVRRLVDAHRHLVAALPRVHGLVRVEGHNRLVLARSDVEEVPTLGVLVLVVEQREVRHVANKRRVQALHREVILTSVVPQMLCALRKVSEEDIDGLCGKHLEGAHEVVPELDVVQVHRRVSGRRHALEMGPQPVGEEDGIHIGLDRPVVVLVGGLLVHLAPHVQEDVRVHHRGPIALRHPHALEHIRGVALVDAPLVGLQHPHDRLLITLLHARSDDAVGGDDREAVERGAGRRAGLLEDMGAQVPAQDIARPRLRVPGTERVALIAATCPLPILLETLETDPPAATRCQTVLALPRARGRRTHSDRRATPSAAARVTVHDPRAARLVATRPKLVLPVTLRPGLAAALLR
mmetsp:Transcript_80992/g.234806  ORF Transcript_80992/g.234806 Transcript_80992/m.234806 type:complete len:464 (+) Transcript_80992:11-1402(+)